MARSYRHTGRVNLTRLMSFLGATGDLYAYPSVPIPTCLCPEQDLTVVQYLLDSQIADVGTGMTRNHRARR